MEIYNHYIHTHLIRTDSVYKSEIGFIKLKYDSVLKYDLYFITFHHGKEHRFKDGVYKSSEILNNLYWENRKNPNFMNRYIEKLQPSTQYYSFVKVINDKQYPILNGQILILKYGKQIFDNLDFSKTLYLNIDMVQGYNNWGKSNVSNIYCDLYDENLNISDFINFKEFDPIKEERKEKLIEIQKLNY
jgi:hypothetical protein